MINSSIKNNFLNLLVGNANSMSGVGGTAYICLGYDVRVSIAGNIELFEEPQNGYKRYLLGNYNQDLTQKVTVVNGVASNKDTLYFDEAEADWTTEDHKLKYFGIANDINSKPFAYGHIVDPNSKQPIELDVRAGQVPIIKVGQLTLSISDSEKLPFDKYYIQVFTETAGAYNQVAKMEVMTTAKFLYDKYQVAVTSVTDINPYTTTIEVGDNYLIANLPQMVDLELDPESKDQYITLYTNNNVATDYKVLIFSEDPDRE